jgi:hypothetical protein
VRPRPEDFATRAEYRWQLKQWKKHHGGGFFGTLVIAVLFGALTGSTTLLFVLVACAIAMTAYARSGP